MVLRRIPGKNWGTKLSTFALILAAGLEQIVITNKEKLVQFVKADHAYLVPQKIRILYTQQQTMSKQVDIQYTVEQEEQIIRYYKAKNIIKAFNHTKRFSRIENDNSLFR